MIAPRFSVDLGDPLVTPPRTPRPVPWDQDQQTDGALE